MPLLSEETLEDVFLLWHSVRIPVLAGITAAFLLYTLWKSVRALQLQQTECIGTSNKIIQVSTPDSILHAHQDSQKPKEVLEGDIPTECPPARPSLKHLGMGRELPKRVKGDSKLKQGSRNRRNATALESNDFEKVQPIIFYASLTATTAQLAQTLRCTLFAADGTTVYPKLSNSNPPNTLRRVILPPQLLNLEETEFDDYFLSMPTENPRTKYVYLVLLPTYDSQESSPAHSFIQHLQDTHHDFRVGTAPLYSLGGFSVFGVGDSSEWGDPNQFCRDAVEVDKWLGRLTGGRIEGSRRIFPLGMGDCNPRGEAKGDLEKQLEVWRIHLEESIRDYALHGELGESAGIRAPVESGEEDSDADLNDEPQEPQRIEMVDVEDIGKMINKGKLQRETIAKDILAEDFTTKGKNAKTATVVEKMMVPKGSPTYDALTKQGYAIIGSHSGVKICRWTKSALRGRGSCYKYSFYGIKSHLCMETTPSLSCSNKCVFCWRHGTNPVGTTWRWKVDEPEDIFRGVVEAHYKKIKMMKGIPGIRADRFAEAFRIRHCALSLVGEPIFYPHINRFVNLLHSSKISSFLVCNAQHPDQLAALQHVTQLYVSIDASNRDSLKRIDRPLHRDFWERFNRCLDILREKRFAQRTVFRLTLVKGFNMADEIKGYADLVEKGLPCFIEVKGVTYCGTSSSSKAGLTMENVPFYDEVKEFVEGLERELQRRSLKYGIAAEHAHSCCALIASERFKIDEKWHTLIDYDKFFELLESGKEFGPTDYIGPPTPKWATWGNGGFNPEDERVYRKGKNNVSKPIAHGLDEENGLQIKTVEV